MEILGEMFQFINHIMILETFKLVRYVTGMEDIKKLTSKHTATLLMYTSWGSLPRKQITGNE